jgi:hypothetical protein
MKREILFRGYSEALNKWVEGGIYTYEGEVTIIHKQGNNLMHNTPVHPDSVGQFTGEIDINGVKVFEGDIDEDGSLVEYSNGSFILTDKETSQYVFIGDCDFIEITGNTFKPQ